MSPAPSRIAKVVIAGQDFVPASALERLHGLLVELANAVDSHCDVDHGTSGCPLALVDRIRREAAQA